MIQKNEQQVWEGSPSQMLNFNAYFYCVLAGVVLYPLISTLNKLNLPSNVTSFLPVLFLLPALVALWRYLRVKCTHYTLTTERLKTTRGVLTRVTDELELYRVKDSRVVEPFFLRIMSLGIIVLVTSDRSHPVVLILGIKGSKELQIKIREMVEFQRMAKGVREID